MKPILLTLVLFFTALATTAQSWQVVGQPGFSEGVEPSLFPQSLALDNNGVPYVAYAEFINEEADVRGVVKKFENGSWQDVGTPFYTNWGNLFIVASLVFNNSNVPYIAYSDQSNSGKLAVKKFEAGTWQSVGTPWITESPVGHTSLAFDINGLLFVSFSDGSNSNKATVMKFESNIWQIVGIAGFSEGPAYHTSLAFDGNNMPYLAYSDYISEQNNDILRVRKFENSSWQSIATEGFYTKWLSHITLAISSDNIIYIAYKNTNNTAEIAFSEFIIKKFQNNSWQTMIEQELEFAYPGGIGLKLYENVPYMCLTDIENNNKATIKKFENESLLIVGEAGFTESYVYDFSFAIKSNGAPYIAFNDNTNNQKVTVMMYDSTMDISDYPNNNILFYPNPANDIVIIANIPDNTNIKVYASTGELVYSLKSHQRAIINCSNFAKGVYFVQIVTDNQSIAVKKLLINR